MENKCKQKSKVFGMPGLNKSKRKLLNYLSPRPKERKDSQNAPLRTENSEKETGFRQKDFENSSINQEYSESICTISDDEKMYSDLKTLPNISVSEAGPCEINAVVELLQSDLSSASAQDVSHQGVTKSLIISSVTNLQTANNIQESKILEEPLYAVINKDKNEQLADKLLAENKKLQLEIQDYLQKSKQEENALHKRLKNEMTQFEEETRREVSTLKSRLQSVIRERDDLAEKVSLLKEENADMQLKLGALDDRISNMILSEVHKKMIADYSRLLNAERKKNKEETMELLKTCEVLEESKSDLEQQLDDLKNSLASRQEMIDNLSDQNQLAIQEKEETMEQLNESKFLTLEIQKLLLALLNVTENLAMERDILLNKVFFQDNQQKELQAGVVNYSLNIGRLQEHIMNISKGNIQELVKLQTDKYKVDENIQDIYEKQIDTLRGKIMCQNTSIFELESEKKKLQSQLENLWDGSDINYKDIFTKLPFA